MKLGRIQTSSRSAQRPVATRTLSALALVISVTVIAAPSSAAPAPVQAVAVVPQLKTSLAHKNKFDLNLFNQNLNFVNGAPELKVHTGRSYMLLPHGAMIVPASARAKTLPAALLPLKAHIESPFAGINTQPKLVDKVWSNEDKQTKVEDQGHRGTCTAFASTGALQAMGKREGHIRDLSENDTFQLEMASENAQCSPSKGFTTWKTASILTEHSICNESFFPYDKNNCPPTAGIPKECTEHANAHFTSTWLIGTDDLAASFLSAANTNLMEAFIKEGHDVVVGLEVAGNTWHNGSGDIDVEIDAGGQPAPSGGGHAMLFVGYDRTKNYFIVKNSWGADWGTHGGYAHMSYEYVQTYAKSLYAVMSASVP